MPIPTLIVQSGGERFTFSLSEIQSQQLSVFTDQTIQLFRTPQPLQWKNSNPAIGSVNSSGVFTPLKIGVTELQTTLKGQNVQFKVVVSQKKGEFEKPTIQLKDGSGPVPIQTPFSNNNSDNLDKGIPATQPSGSPTNQPTSPAPSPIVSSPQPTQSPAEAPNATATPTQAPTPFPPINLPPLPQIKNLKVTSTFTTLKIFWEVTELELAVGFNLYLNGKLIPPTGTLQKEDTVFSYIFDKMNPNETYLLGISALNTLTGETNPETIEGKTASLSLAKPTNNQSFSLNSLIPLKALIENHSEGEAQGQISFTLDDKTLQTVNNSWDTNGYSQGEYQLQAHFKNTANQTLSSSEKITVTLFNSTGSIQVVPPQILSVSPINNYSDIAHTITITGTVLSADTTATLNSQPPIQLTNLIFEGDTKITATIPPTFKKGTFSITFKNPSGTLDATSDAVITLKKRHFVDKDATGANNGNTWADAFNFVDEALTASNSNEEFWIADGTYTPTRGALRTAIFALKEGHKLYGGFNGTELELSARNSTANPVTLSGDLNGDDVGITNNGENVFTVVTKDGMASNQLLDSLTISGGNANGGAGFDFGGGIRHVNGNLTLNDVTLQFNRALTGGAMLISGTTTTTMTNISVLNNTSVNQAGGINITDSAQVTMDNAYFDSNNTSMGAGGAGGAIRCNNGGGTSSLTITNSVLNNNNAHNGAGIRCSDFIVNVSRTIITNNTSSFGAALRMDNVTNATTITDSIIMANTAPEGGAAAFGNNTFPIFRNVLFVNNNAPGSGRGGAIKTSNNSHTQLLNCTFYGNTANNQGGGIVSIGSSRTTIINSIFWANTAPTGPQIHDTGGAGNNSNISFSNIQGGVGAVVGANNLGGNVNIAAQFLNNTDPDGVDNRMFTADDGFNLKAISPVQVRDQGTNVGVPLLDILGTVRPLGAGHSMGAYEF